MKIEIVLKGRIVNPGYGKGVAIVSDKPISFFGDVDRTTGRIVNKELNIYGKSLKGKILVAPCGRGSTVGAWVIYALKKNKVAPAAIVLEKSDTVIASGCIIAGIPLIDQISPPPQSIIAEGDIVEVLEDGTIKIYRDIRAPI